jgi:acetyl esterase/lipase
MTRFLTAVIRACYFAAAVYGQQQTLTYLSPRSQAPALTMDVVTPNGSGPFPVVLLLHGGGFERGSPKQMDAIAAQLRKAGLASASVSYRMAPRFQHPAQLQDVKAAVRYLRANASKLSLDARHVCAVGDEAGATLALLAAFTRGVARFEGRAEHREQSSAVDCVVSRGALAAAPAAWAGTEDALAETNPRLWVTPDVPPAQILSGAAGRKDADLLVARLRAAGVEAIAVATAENAGELPVEAIAFLTRRLRPAPDRWTVLLADHGPGAELIAIGWPSGRVLWRVPNGTGLDVHSLPNGHALFTDHALHKVIEIDAHQKEVWSLGPEAGLATPYSVRRLGNGNTLVGDAKGARYTEFTPQGTVAWKWERPDLTDQWPRMARPTPAGTTLITFQKGGMVFEVDRQGRTLWEHRTDPARLPYQAIRLANGNTLIGLVDPGEVIEVDRKGATVRSVGGPSGKLRLGWIAGIDPLPNGGMMIADFTGKRVLEVDAAGRLVHELRDLPWAIASIAVAMPNGK